MIRLMNLLESSGPHAPGDVWKTPKGIAGMNRANVVAYFYDEDAVEKARVWVSGNDTQVPGEQNKHKDSKRRGENKLRHYSSARRSPTILMKMLAGHQRKYLNSLNGKTRDSIKAYAGSGYEVVNGILRGNVRGLKNRLVGAIIGRRLVEDLDNAFENLPPMKNNAVVYRGLNKDVADRMVGAMGETLTDDGFMSTSAHPGIAEAFSRDFDNAAEKGAILKILVPKGSRAMYLNAGSLGKKTEHEVLLPRGTSLTIEAVKTESLGDTHRRIIYARVEREGE